MPFIDVKLSKKITNDEKEKLKTELGKSIKILHKPESYLMVGICDNYDLYFAGNKLENGAFVAISIFGNVNSDCSESMTSAVCDILNKQFNIAGSDVYVTYSGIADWGWNGSNF